MNHLNTNSTIQLRLPIKIWIVLPLITAISACGGNAAYLKMQSEKLDLYMPAPMVYAAAPPIELNMTDKNHESYQSNKENEVKQTSTDSVSTLSLDVDTGAYANIRRILRQGKMPPVDAVRIEEMLNYFNYADAAPNKTHPFSVSTELAASPWNTHNLILKVGVKAVDVKTIDQPAANLVFLVDVSGSMSEQNKLPLVQATLRLLTKQLRPQDKVSLIVYAGRTAIELEPTSGADKAKILSAIDRLQANGSTNGESALRLAYQQATQSYIKNGINRILLMTDGDFNVGISNPEQMKEMVSKEREKGISLSTFGFGVDNYQESMMEQIADAGNGNYSYIDSLEESKKVLDDELAATFNTVAKDVKLQLEFNPTQIKEWRLIGYENRVLQEQDFKNDKVDAAEIGAGKSVIALYELTPTGKTGLFADRRYADKKTNHNLKNNELGFLKVRYKQPTGQISNEFSVALANHVNPTPSIDLKFSTAVAGFGQLLKGSKYQGQWSYVQSADLAKQSLGSDRGGYRAEFVKLVELAESISAPTLATEK